jgi:hypothetical protein
MTSTGPYSVVGRPIESEAHMAKTAFEQFDDAIPYEREFHLPMVADSTNEVAVDIDTDIPAGGTVGWTIVGMEWQFVDIASPYTKRNSIITAGVNNMTLQLGRGEAPGTVTLMHPGDDDLIAEDILCMQYAAGGEFPLTWPRGKAIRDVTQLGTLHVRFATSVDVTDISATTIEIFGKVLYYPVHAPKAPSSIR